MDILLVIGAFVVLIAVNLAGEIVSKRAERRERLKERERRGIDCADT